MSKRTQNLLYDFVRPAKTQISLRIRAVWSESSLIARTYYSLEAIQRGINENPCHTGWMYMLIWVFAGYTGLIVGFIVCWLINIEKGINEQTFASLAFHLNILIFSEPRDSHVLLYKVENICLLDLQLKGTAPYFAQAH